MAAASATAATAVELAAGVGFVGLCSVSGAEGLAYL